MVNIVHYNHNWHPTTNQARLNIARPLEVVEAKGSKIKLANNKWLIDCISSWWCKSLGHSHPRLKQALALQADSFEHVIFANCTYDGIEKLSHRLAQLHQDSDAKVFYSGDGSSAVEVALKLTHHYAKDNTPGKTKFIALTNGYHGETIGAMSVSCNPLYKNSYQEMCFATDFITVPYDTDPDLSKLNQQLNALEDCHCAIIVEPLFQGAGGMYGYHPKVLQRLVAFARQRHIAVIADEIMTGMGRCGDYLAMNIANEHADIFCLSKSLTSGWLPFSATVVSEKIYEHFISRQFSESFLHSHTFCGNPLGSALALEVFSIIEEENILKQVVALNKKLSTLMDNVVGRYQIFFPPRGLGGVIAIELTTPPRQPEIFPAQVTKIGIKHGILIRPLGSVIYLMPPLNISDKDFIDMSYAFEATIADIHKSLI